MTQLSDEAVRILGSLVEKERTVPDTYPLTLNSLVTACNQSSNRSPVVDYDHGTVQRTLDDLKATGWVRFVHPSHGERTTKFRQVADERLGVEPDELAVLAVLFLRGPQTVGELRSRTERLHELGSIGEVQSSLDRLAARDEPLVVRLERRPGEREERWAHTLSPVPAHDAASARHGPHPTPASDASDVTAAAVALETVEARLAALERHVAHLYAILGEEPPSPTV